MKLGKIIPLFLAATLPISGIGLLSCGGRGTETYRVLNAKENAAIALEKVEVERRNGKIDTLNNIVYLAGPNLENNDKFRYTVLEDLTQTKIFDRTLGDNRILFGVTTHYYDCDDKKWYKSTPEDSFDYYADLLIEFRYAADSFVIEDATKGKVYECGNIYEIIKKDEKTLSFNKSTNTSNVYKRQTVLLKQNTSFTATMNNVILDYLCDGGQEEMLSKKLGWFKLDCYAPDTIRESKPAKRKDILIRAFIYPD